VSVFLLDLLSLERWCKRLYRTA